MIRLLIALAACAACAAAQAQPAPRVTLDVNLPAPNGFVFGPTVTTGQLAVGRDGVHYVLQHTLKPPPDLSTPASDARIDILALAPDGVLKQRSRLPVRLAIGPGGFALNALGVVVARSGDLGVFMSAGDPIAALTGSSKETTTLFRLAPDFSVKKASRIGPPGGGDSDESLYYVSIYLPTSDNAIMLGGGYGLGPLSWWMGKFSLDGVRLWRGGMGRGIPEEVAAIRQRPDGTWLSLVTEMHPRADKLDWFIRRNTADGRLLTRTRLAGIPTFATAAILRDSIVIVTNGNEPARGGEFIVLDDGGRILRRTPWPFVQTWSTIADGDGIAAIVADSFTGEMPKYVVRADTRAGVRWRSAAINAREIVRTADGQIAALAHIGKNDEALHLMRFADP